MPTEQDEIEDLPETDEGRSEQTDAAAEATATAQPDSAKSSDAHDGTEDDSSLSVVRAVGDKAKAASEGASSAQGEAEGAEPAAQSTKKEPDDRDFTDVPFHKHPRFQQVIGRLKVAEDAATKYNHVQNYMDNVGLSGEEGANALYVAGLMKTDPGKAWEALQPMLQDVLTRAGLVPSKELQAEIDSGRVTAEAAQRISRADAEVANLRARQASEAARAEAQRQRQTADSFVNAAETWESERREKDPNFAKKVPLIEREIAWLHRTEGRPDTADVVKDQLKRAYDAANKQFRPAAPDVPARKPIAPVRGGQVSGNAAPAPQSTLEIIRSKNRDRAT